MLLTKLAFRATLKLVSVELPAVLLPNREGAFKVLLKLPLTHLRLEFPTLKMLSRKGDRLPFTTAS